MSKSTKKKLQAKRKKAAAKKVRNAVKNSSPRIPELDGRGLVRGKVVMRHKLSRSTRAI